MAQASGAIKADEESNSYRKDQTNQIERFNGWEIAKSDVKNESIDVFSFDSFGRRFVNSSDIKQINSNHSYLGNFKSEFVQNCKQGDLLRDFRSKLTNKTKKICELMN